MKKENNYSNGGKYIVIHNKEEDTYSGKSFYLRTGKNIEKLASEAEKEFGKKENLLLNTGKFSHENNEIKIYPEYSPNITHLITEGLFYNKKGKEPMTMRNPTKKLYNSITGFITDIEESKEDLTALLTDLENPVEIKIAGVNPYDHDFSKRGSYNALSRGFLESRTIAMNYCDAFGNSYTFFVDGKETDFNPEWYILPNNHEQVPRTREIFNKKAKKGVISKSRNHHFKGAGIMEKSLFFDGTLRDLISELTKKGVSLEEGLSLDDFSNR